MTDITGTANDIRQDHQTPSIDTLTTAERELLRLLAAGATHQTVANRLDIPLRTVRRRIAALMKQLDAISPFQAGAEAAWRGWLVAPPREHPSATRLESGP